MDNIFLPKINFSKDYYKLHNQTSAKLIHVEELILNDRVSQEFLNYDTTAKDGSMYSLKKGRYLLLVFLGNKNIPFTTVRSYNVDKERYYNDNKYKEFKINYSNGVKLNDK